MVDHLLPGLDRSRPIASRSYPGLVQLLSQAPCRSLLSSCRRPSLAHRHLLRQRSRQALQRPAREIASGHVARKACCHQPSLLCTEEREGVIRDSIRAVTTEDPPPLPLPLAHPHHSPPPLDHPPGVLDINGPDQWASLVACGAIWWQEAWQAPRHGRQQRLWRR